jgi:hypothetical protein
VRSARDLDEIVELVQRAEAPLYARVSRGPDDDRDQCSVDYESGLELPGLSVHPLSPPRWWRDRPLLDWVARQLAAYAHLREGHPDRSLWILTGTEVDRGPDNEPLVVGATAVLEVDDELLDAACRHHDAHASSRPEDRRR